MQAELALGCAQIGTRYGICNSSGPPSSDQLRELLDGCYDHGVRTLDTALAYPNSEKAIGRYLRSTQRTDWFVITKWIFDREPAALWEESLARLGGRPHAVLSHRTEELLADPCLVDWIVDLKTRGEIRSWGCSVYSPDQALKLMETATPDIVQVPLNLFDQRAIQSGLLDQCCERGIEVHVRSAFLQGAVFLPTDQVAVRFPTHAERFKSARVVASERNMELHELCLHWLSQISGVSKIVLGAERWRQMSSNIEVLSKNCQDLSSLRISSLATCDLSLIDPSRWK